MGATVNWKQNFCYIYILKSMYLTSVHTFLHTKILRDINMASFYMYKYSTLILRNII